MKKLAQTDLDILRILREPMTKEEVVEQLKAQGGCSPATVYARIPLLVKEGYLTFECDPANRTRRIYTTKRLEELEEAIWSDATSTLHFIFGIDKRQRTVHEMLSECDETSKKYKGMPHRFIARAVGHLWSRSYRTQYEQFLLDPDEAEVKQFLIGLEIYLENCLQLVRHVRSTKPFFVKKPTTWQLIDDDERKLEGWTTSSDQLHEMYHPNAPKTKTVQQTVARATNQNLSEDERTALNCSECKHAENPLETHLEHRRRNHEKAAKAAEEKKKFDEGLRSPKGFDTSRTTEEPKQESSNEDILGLG